MKIIGKLILGFVLIAMLGAAVGTFGIINLQRIEAADTYLYENMTAPLGDLLIITESFQRVRINVRDLLDTDSDADVARYKQIINELSARVVKAAETYEKGLTTEGGRKLFDAFIASRKVYRGHLDEILRLAEAGKIAEAKNIVEGDARTAALAEQEAINALVDHKLRRARETSDANTALANSTALVMIVVILISTVLSVILGVFLSLSISRPLRVAVNHLGEMAKGDLRSDIPAAYLKRSDEIGDLAKALDNFSRDLRRIVESILSASGQVSAGSQQISSTAQ